MTMRFAWRWMFVLALAVGPGPLVLLHQAQANRAWPLRTTVVADRSNDGEHPTPLDKKPGAPAHDASTCVVCMVLHAPMAVQADALLAGLEIQEDFLFAPVDLCAGHIGVGGVLCRGPPVL